MDGNKREDNDRTGSCQRYRNKQEDNDRAGSCQRYPNSERAFGNTTLRRRKILTTKSSKIIDRNLHTDLQDRELSMFVCLQSHYPGAVVFNIYWPGRKGVRPIDHPGR
jgi:hypothetical protein